MKPSALFAGVVAVAALVAVLVSGTRSPAPAQPNAAPLVWEHKVISLSALDLGDTKLEKTLNSFGAEGWEVASVQSTGSGLGTTGTVVLKRPKK